VGDFMQVQVGQRIKKRYTESPLSLYRALRSLNPSPYMYYYHFGDFHVVGASPEILVRQEQREQCDGLQGGESHHPTFGGHSPARRHARAGQGR
jgi:isochorismate synthase EntC